MSLISPRAVLARVARQVPADCRQHIIVIGSLAAAYQLLAETEDTQVRTKDIDCILVPRIEAIRAGKAVAEALLTAGWRPPAEGLDAAPGTAQTGLHVGQWTELAGRVGDGVRALLVSEGDLREALEISRGGLLAPVLVTPGEFRAVAERLVVDAIEPLEEAGRGAAEGA